MDMATVIMAIHIRMKNNFVSYPDNIVRVSLYSLNN